MCPSCQCVKIHPILEFEIDALDFWCKPIDNILQGETTRVIDTEEHTAQLYSTLLDADDVYEIVGCSNIRMAVPPNQRIIILNKGMGSKGFSICCDCDAAMHADDPVVLKDILRPYHSRFNKTKCRHVEADNARTTWHYRLTPALQKQENSKRKRCRKHRVSIFK